jgi:hypothetical protein
LSFEVSCSLPEKAIDAASSVDESLFTDLLKEANERLDAQFEVFQVELLVGRVNAVVG